MIAIYQIKRNYKILLATVALFILILAVKNPTVSSEYAADFITGCLQALVEFISRVVDLLRFK
ncbi:hypothetical protein SAMN05421578_101318 [Paenibacillus macquariensis]|uniref:TMhelix containing protein n=1 Tax=Paenibacillus macquariensis TaxID=948756 RepID=A0ABY1JKH0_9BACL|nr:hypothetical protein SAMN05421578_101318 [Paenibacillus macquariensis]